MNRFKKVRLVFSILLAVFFCFYYLNISAETVCVDDGTNDCSVPDGEEVVREMSPTCKALVRDEDGNAYDGVRNKYKPLVKLEGNNFIFSISPHSSTENLDNVKFQLISVNGVDFSGKGYFVSKNNILSIDKNEFASIVNMAAAFDLSFIFKMDSVNRDPGCTEEDVLYGNLVFMDAYTDEGPDINTGEEGTGETIEVSSGNPIDCDNQDGSDFSTNFCIAKDFAQTHSSIGSTRLDYTDQFSSSSGLASHPDTAKFTCNFAVNSTPSYYTSSNTSHMFGSGTLDLNIGSYIYHLHGPDDVHSGAGDAVKCKVKCEEAVTVEYGAPVASKAGLCFEYKVKVTSRVSCSVIEEPAPYKLYPLCTPSATCTGTNSSGYTYTVTEGGPNENFDMCVYGCDGGKYTSKCSKKCYNQVYKNSLLKYNSVKNMSIDDAVQQNYDVYSGYYYSPDHNNIYWTGSPGIAGRWYHTLGYPGEEPSGCKPNYIVDDNYGNGICRHDYGSSVCNDNCRWKTGCLNGRKYLNPYFKEADEDSNKILYQEAVNRCSAAASCSTRTAEFTISANYIDGSGTVKTVTFPYNTDPDELISSNTAFDSDSLPAGSTLFGHNGCYGNSNNIKDFYVTEWGFPGSWINRKTGELSYVPPTGTGWQEVDNKFCVPFDAKNVNESWWNYYYTMTDSNFEPKQYTVSESSLNYNINAKASDFGYYGWNIEVECFYGLNKDDTCPPGEDCEIDYIIRSVDLENLFPATDGTSLGASDTMGREPGFNWTLKAKNFKNSNYESSPLDYAKRIQDKGYTIYSDDSQLDYKFHLTPAVLRELKANYSTDYTEFRGESITDSNGVIRYTSDLDILDDPSITLKRPTAAGRLCNNVKDGSSCENDFIVR